MGQLGTVTHSPPPPPSLGSQWRTHNEALLLTPPPASSLTILGSPETGLGAACPSWALAPDSASWTTSPG